MYPDVRQGPVVAKLSLARGIAREAELAMLAAFPADARRGDGAARARRSGPRAEPDLVRALPARLPLRRGPVRGQPPAARPGARLEAAREAERRQDVSAALSPEKQARLAKAVRRRDRPRLRGALRGAAAAARAPHAAARASSEIGCATGQLTRELARRFDGKSRITALRRGGGVRRRGARARWTASTDLRAPITFRVGGAACASRRRRIRGPRGVEPGGRRRRRSRAPRPRRWRACSRPAARR